MSANPPNNGETNATSAAGGVAAPSGKTPSASELLAELLTATPHLRAQILGNPTREIGKLLPRRKYWIYDDARTHPDSATPPEHTAREYPHGREEPGHRPAPDPTPVWHPFWRKPLFHPIKFFLKRRENRARFAEKVLLDVAQLVKTGKLAAVVNTDAVFEDYFAPIVRTSRRGFNVIFGLSIGVFVAGSALIGSGVFLIYHDPSTNSTIAGSIFGGGGAVAALGSIYSLSTAGISDASSNHARLRMALTGFATELGQLRWLADNLPNDERVIGRTMAVREINDAIQKSMTNAVGLIPMAEPTPNTAKRTIPKRTNAKPTAAKPDRAAAAL